MVRNPGKHWSIHLVNFYNSQLSGRKHCELLSASRRGKASFYWELSHPADYFAVYSGFFMAWTVRIVVYFRGRDTLAGLRPGAAVWRLHEAAMRARPCANPPARRADLCPFVSCDTQPVFVLKFIHDGYVSLPIAYAGSPAERTDKLFSAAGLAGPGWGRRAAEGPAGAGAPPHHSRPGRAAASRPPPPEYERGWLSASQILFKCKRM